MPFIGQQPLTGAYSKLDSITTSATATYNLQLDSAAYSPASANHLLVSLNGVMQAPQDSFTVSGSTITFASALTSSDNIDFIMAMGDVLNIGTPSDGTVTTAKITNGAVTNAKIASGITASKLTGALPAISGAALTGIAPLSGGIPQKISSTVSAVTFTGIPSTAKIIYLSWFNVTAPAQFYIRLRVGGATITSGYLSSLTYRYAGSVSNNYQTAGGSRYDIAAIQFGSWGATSPYAGFAVITRNDAVTDTDYSYSVTGQTQLGSYNTYGGVGFSAGRYDASAAVDGIEFTGNSGLTAGTFNVWYQ
jgi:hypothetical protein